MWIRGVGGDTVPSTAVGDLIAKTVVGEAGREEGAVLTLGWSLGSRGGGQRGRLGKERFRGGERRVPGPGAQLTGRRWWGLGRPPKGYEWVPVSVGDGGRSVVRGLVGRPSWLPG